MSAKLFSDILIVFSSNAIAFVSAFLLNPILIKLFGFKPDAFGSFQMLLSYSAIISSLQFFSLDLSYISDSQPRNQDHVISIFIALMTSGTVVTMMMCAYFSIFSHVRLIPLSILTLSNVLYMSLYTISRDQKDFIKISKSLTIKTATNFALTIILAFYFKNDTALYVSQSISTILACHTLIKPFTENYNENIKFNGKFLTNLIRNNYNLIIFETSMNLFNTISGNLPLLLLEKSLGSKIFGLFALAYRILVATNGLLTKAISEIFLPYISKSTKDKEMVFKLFPSICLFFFVIYLTISITSPIFVPVLFGRENFTISNLISILCIWMFAQIAVSPFTTIIIAEKKSHISLALAIVFAALRVLSIYATKKYSYNAILASFSITSFLLYYSYAYFSLKLAGDNRIKSNLLILLLSAASLQLITIYRTPGIALSISTLLITSVLLYRQQKESSIC